MNGATAAATSNSYDARAAGDIIAAGKCCAVADDAQRQTSTSAYFRQTKRMFRCSYALESMSWLDIRALKRRTGGNKRHDGAGRLACAAGKNYMHCIKCVTERNNGYRARNSMLLFSQINISRIGVTLLSAILNTLFVSRFVVTSPRIIQATILCITERNKSNKYYIITASQLPN